MILQALVLLVARPAAKTTIAYDFRGFGRPERPAIEVRVTERIDAVHPDGTLKTSRLYTNIVQKGGVAMKGIESIAGKRDHFTVGPTGEWVQTTPNIELGFPDFPFPATSVPIGHTWDPGRNLRGVQARLKETRTIAGHRVAVIDFPALSNVEGRDRIGPGSYWVTDLADGRPLFARLELVDKNPADSAVFTIVRRGIPGLVPKL